ncbi:MAG: hypothetical protein AB7S38_32575 [Vulcanimicrobiota bacterium]
MKRLLLLIILATHPVLAEPKWHAELIGFTDNGLKQVGMSWTTYAAPPAPLPSFEGSGWMSLWPFSRSSSVYEASMSFMESQGDCQVFSSVEQTGPTLDFDGHWLEGWTPVGPHLRASVISLGSPRLQVKLDLTSSFSGAQGRFRTSCESRRGDYMGIECLDATRQPMAREGFPHTRVDLDEDDE